MREIYGANSPKAAMQIALDAPDKNREHLQSIEVELLTGSRDKFLIKRHYGPSPPSQQPKVGG